LTKVSKQSLLQTPNRSNKTSTICLKIHNDVFIDPNLTESHRYFDFSWDISRIYKNLHTHKHQLARQLARAVQKNALLQKQLGLPKYLNGDPIVLVTTVYKGVPIIKPAENFVADSQVSEGVVSDLSWTHTRKRTVKHKPPMQVQLSEGVFCLPTQVLTPTGDPSPALTTGPSHEPYIGHKEEPE
jgi:hypothetical protein